MATAIGEAAPGSQRGWQLHGSRSAAFLIAAIGAALLAHLHMALTRAVNWDEFYHYSQVQKLAHGTLNEPLQTLYARAFVWIADTPGSGIDHIILIRLFMLVCEVAITGAIIGIASRFTDRTTGGLCALAYLTAAYVLQHGSSFRFDAPAAAMLMTAAWMLLRWRLGIGIILIVGLLAGTSAMLTIKTILYAPVFLGVAWLLWSHSPDRRGTTLRLVAVALVASLSFAAIYLLHSSWLAPGSEAEATKLLASAGDKMVALTSYWRYTVRAVRVSPAQALIIVLFPVMLWRGKRPGAEKIALAGFYLPILTLFFYHNTAPYFYVYMLPPVLVACSIVFQSIVRRVTQAAIASLFLLTGSMILASEPPNTIGRQREILRVADGIFPNGVAYFDSCAMLGRFPKANVFMTPWGIARYQAGDYPSIETTMAGKPVPLLVNDDYMFEDALTGTGPVASFLPSDLAAIRDTYIPLWGPFWIAGEVLKSGAVDREIQIRVPGPYTVRDGTIILDGRRLEAGKIVELKRGMHRISVTGRDARLTWGKGLAIPGQPDKGGPIFMAF